MAIHSGIGEANINKAMTIMDYIETNFECAGICNISTLYTFSDVSLGPPS